MEKNNFEDNVLNKDYNGARFSTLERQYNAYLDTINYASDIAKYDEDLLDDYEELKYNTKLWRDIYPQ